MIYLSQDISNYKFLWRDDLPTLCKLVSLLVDQLRQFNFDFSCDQFDEEESHGWRHGDDPVFEDEDSWLDEL